jgi:hypothetical protein
MRSMRGRRRRRENENWEEEKEEEEEEKEEKEEKEECVEKKFCSEKMSKSNDACHKHCPQTCAKAAEPGGSTNPWA